MNNNSRLNQNIKQKVKKEKPKPFVSLENNNNINKLDHIKTEEKDHPEVIRKAEPPGVKSAELQHSAQKLIDAGQRDKGKSESFRGFCSQSRMAYSLQVGAFLLKENATNWADMLEKKGYLANIVKFIDAKGRNWYTVRLGAYNSLKVAEKQAVDFSTKEKLDSIVRPVGRF